MTANISVHDWIAVLDDEYLAEFIPAGGAAVKFAAAADESVTAAKLADHLVAAAKKRDLIVASVSAADVRVHMLDKLFGAVARQLPWRELVLCRLTALATGSFVVPEHLGAESFARQVALANEADEDYVRMVMGQRIAQQVFKDRALSRDFRIAMTWMCRAVLEGGPGGQTEFDDILGWLTGDVRLISALKAYQIYTKINRANARHHFESMFTWVRRCDRPGTAIIVDGDRFTDRERHHDGSINYTKSSRLDAYEVFRQFIDSTDQMRAALLVVVTNREFLDTEPGSRGLGAYQALMNRIFDEVHDRRHANPMSSLVRLAEAAA